MCDIIMYNKYIEILTGLSNRDFDYTSNSNNRFRVGIAKSDDRS